MRTMARRNATGRKNRQDVCSSGRSRSSLILRGVVSIIGDRRPRLANLECPFRSSSRNVHYTLAIHGSCNEQLQWLGLADTQWTYVGYAMDVRRPGLRPGTAWSAGAAFKDAAYVEASRRPACPGPRDVGHVKT